MPILVSTIAVLACTPALADPRYELAIDPVSWVNHQYAASASVALAPQVIVRADGGIGIGTENERRAGLSAKLFLDRAFHGPYVEPGVIWRDTTMDYGCLGGPQDEGCPPARARWTSAAALVGYQWTFATHFSLAAAAGYSRPISGEPSAYDGDGPQLEGYVRAGYVW
jgi:hypothetical protein